MFPETYIITSDQRIKDDEKGPEGAAQRLPAGDQVRERVYHVLPEVQEARLCRVHEDLARLRHRFPHHGRHWLLHQACVHPNQQHHPVLSVREKVTMHDDNLIETIHKECAITRFVPLKVTNWNKIFI